MSDSRADAFRVEWPPGTERVPSGFFDRLYATSADPWALAERWYEERKYDLTVAALPRRRYRRALEVGCSIGLLTVRLAGRCDALVAGDVAAPAVAAARQRVLAHGLRSVRVETMEPPDRWPEGTFDLIVLSEVLYFSAGRRLDRFIKGALDKLQAGGHLVAVHYRAVASAHLLTGDAVHERLRTWPGLRRVVHHAEEEFLLDVLQPESL